MVKRPRNEDESKRNEMWEKCRAELQENLKAGRKVYFVDEIIFTFNSRQRIEYSARRDNIRVIEREESKGYKAVIAAISFEDGVDQI